MNMRAHRLTEPAASSTPRLARTGRVLRLPDPLPLLEAALLLAAQLLLARHPAALPLDDGPRHRGPPRLRAARALLGLINALLGALVDYRSIEPNSSSATAVDEIPY